MEIAKLTIILPFLLSIGHIYSQSPFSDCGTGIFLCNKDGVFQPELTDSGYFPDQISDLVCSPAEKPFTESNSIWYKWEISEGGTLAFTILPFNEQDDIDFVLFRLPPDSDDCDQKEVVRCMRAGPVLGMLDSLNLPSCTGATGLKIDTEKVQTTPGCNSNSDQFLSSLKTVKGEKYALLINNYRSKGGFALNFDGSSKFRNDLEGCLSLTDNEYKVGASFTAEVYPNPTTGIINISWKSEKNQLASLQVIDPGGIIKYESSFTLADRSGILSVPVNALTEGNYFIKIRSGSDTEVLQFFKK